MGASVGPCSPFSATSICGICSHMLAYEAHRRPILTHVVSSCARALVDHVHLVTHRTLPIIMTMNRRLSAPSDGGATMDHPGPQDRPHQDPLCPGSQRIALAPHRPPPRPPQSDAFPPTARPYGRVRVRIPEPVPPRPSALRHDDRAHYLARPRRHMHVPLRLAPAASTSRRRPHPVGAARLV